MLSDGKVTPTVVRRRVCLSGGQQCYGGARRRAIAPPPRPIFHWVAGPPRDDPQPVRGCGADTAAVEALADWLATCGITTLALASTGVYWSPLFALLATRGFAVLLVDPQQGQKITGRPKRDRHDCQGRQRLPTFGLRAAAFRPASPA